MKLAHFTTENHARWGVVEGGQVIEVVGSIYGDWELSKSRYLLSSVKILPPDSPNKLIGVGLNYADHCREAGRPIPEEPFIFLKAPTAMIGHEQAIAIPFPDHEIHHEGELTLVIRRAAKNVEPEDALNYVLGYTCGNDVSDRTMQKRDSAPTRGKSLDTFAPLGPFIVTDIGNPDKLQIECLVNGVVRQSSNTDQFVFNVPTLVSFLSKMMTLLPGDLVMTGTPPGVGPIRAGDVVEVRIEGIGTLRNSVRSA